MLDEFNALLRQGTWSLVPSSSHQNAAGCKWVFKNKRCFDRSIKAHLITKGFHQHSGINYFDTFSPAVKSITIRTILSIVVSCGWGIWQLDVKNAFLHGYLSEAMFMQQPSDFADPLRPTHV
ncbi:unnamed protein product [Prunus armeniaca]|uniref:Reverse transcriptase Ty1/copia-type domain-containing protein n=1 Tax=Prunus armeniaca TaxID=36596 RepID=A0A6J5WTR9_PRUAR|nr:unnamed protein product [Prunus armeniaca]